MKKILIILAVLALIVLVFVLLLAFGLGSRLRGGGVPDRTILEVNFEQPLAEYVPNDEIAQILLEDVATVRDVVEALERATEDERVVALVARVGNAGLGLATLQELRDAVIAFRGSGKKAVAFAETFGEFTPGNGSYYLATAFDEVYLQPSGDVNLTGLLYQNPFLAGTLEKLGIEAQMDHRYEYKNAMNLFTEKEFTEAHEEALGAVMESHFEQIVGGIAEGRGLTPEQVRAVLDRGPILGPQTVEAGLVDGLAYRDEVYARLKDEVGSAGGEAGGEEARFLYFMPYLKRAGRPHTRGETIALIYGVGNVARGENEYGATGSMVMGSDTVAGALRDAIDDPDVAAILFRVDSPGGSYVASDTIWRETVRAREAGKPVIVSMADVAGSGGYFVAMSADKIVAHPGTITGSIGVLAGKFVTTGFWDKLGVSFDSVAAGANAHFYDSQQPYSPEEWARFQAWLDRIYEDFTSKVAEGRNLPKERVLEIARGRIWSGARARELGLVDELGGFPTALRLAREAAGLAPDAEVRLKLFPKPQSPFEILFGEGPESSESRATAAFAARALEVLGPALRLARQLGLLESSPGERVLAMPPLQAVP